jgi:hypothetical protein
MRFCLAHRTELVPARVDRPAERSGVFRRNGIEINCWLQSMRSASRWRACFGFC